MRLLPLMFSMISMIFVLASSFGCRSTSAPEKGERRSMRSMSTEEFADQFEATEFAKCIDSEGRSTGSLNFIWHISKSNGDAIVPYIVGFNGSLRSLQGTLVEFQSLTTSKEERYTAPPVHNPINFPLGSYAGFSLQFPYDEQDGSWAFIRINDQRIRLVDITGAQLLVPKFVIGGEYSTRYYLKLEGGLFHEFSCQAISDKVRSRLSTYMRKDGQHKYDGDRGSRAKFFRPPQQLKPLNSVNTLNQKSPTASELLEVMNKPTELPIKPQTPEVTPASSVRDFRPIGRPAAYDIQYKHTRIFECGRNGALDAIWRIKNEKGAELAPGKIFITGFAGELQDTFGENAFYFSSVALEASPAFYSGQMPSNGSYYFPSIEFKEEQFKNNISVHSKLPGLKPGQNAAAGTIYLPRNGSGRSISVSLALGNSLRSMPYQATADCNPLHPRVKNWLRYCVGTDAQTANEHCKI